MACRATRTPHVLGDGHTLPPTQSPVLISRHSLLRKLTPTITDAPATTTSQINKHRPPLNAFIGGQTFPERRRPPLIRTRFNGKVAMLKSPTLASLKRVVISLPFSRHQPLAEAIRVALKIGPLTPPSPPKITPVIGMPLLRALGLDTPEAAKLGVVAEPCALTSSERTTVVRHGLQAAVLEKSRVSLISVIVDRLPLTLRAATIIGERLIVVWRRAVTLLL